MTILAAVQASSVWLDREATIDKACGLIAEAGKAGASLVAFPENFVPGHPSWFHYLPGGHRDSISRALRLIDQSVTIPGPSTDRLAEAARMAGTTVVIGLTERAPGASGTLYNTQLCIGPDGALIGKHQKLVATMTERMVHSPGGAETQRTFETPLGVVSSLICGENSNPLALGMIAAQHPLVHVASWPAHVSPSSLGGVREISGIASRGVAHMLGCFVVSASGVNDAGMIADIAITDEDRAFLADPEKNGGACIVNPSGVIIAGPLEGNTEGIVTADVDFDACLRSRLINDMGGHYNRSDVYQLRVDNRAAPLVTLIRDEPAQAERDQENGEDAE
ncbi:carbon-nitrogen hydrolase family protein [Leifsonia bigeumensis]|uniref:Carbon-nitrogen hydrolase family protein n=1 Tax=Leifsonella bigeumensis TaxID=433643 RepID=A0ABP7FHB0_9MICO